MIQPVFTGCFFVKYTIGTKVLFFESLNIITLSNLNWLPNPQT